MGRAAVVRDGGVLVRVEFCCGVGGCCRGLVCMAGLIVGCSVGDPVSRKVLVIVGLVAVLAGVVSPVAATAKITSSGPQTVVELRDAVAALPVAGENRDGYQRELFRHWIDADHDGCNTRAEVLIVEAVVELEVGPSCRLTGGRWYSEYDDVVVSSASSLDIDHMVPLAEAWDSGASVWTAARRKAYANDLDADRALIGVTARSNRSKSDKDPVEWLPPFEPAWCQYIADWVLVKSRWMLAVDKAEKSVLTDLAGECPNVELEFTPASDQPYM